MSLETFEHMHLALTALIAPSTFPSRNTRSGYPFQLPEPLTELVPPACAMPSHYCKCCNMWQRDYSQWQEHEIGKFHRSNVRRRNDNGTNRCAGTPHWNDRDGPEENALGGAGNGVALIAGNGATDASARNLNAPATACRKRASMPGSPGPSPEFASTGVADPHSKRELDHIANRCLLCRNIVRVEPENLGGHAHGILVDENISNFLHPATHTYSDPMHCLSASSGVSQYHINGFANAYFDAGGTLQDLDVYQRSITLQDLDVYQRSIS